MCRSMRWKVPSIPMTAYDPRLPREQETPLEIGRDWWLDRGIPASGFVRILDSSQVWKEREEETRIITTEGLPTCLAPGRGWTITSGDGTFWKSRSVGQATSKRCLQLFQNETKRTEELEDAEYRSPTWSVLRALQTVGKTQPYYRPAKGQLIH